MTPFFKRSLAFAATAGLFGLTAVSAFAQSPSLLSLHEFSATDAQGANSDGANPSQRLVQAFDGNFYGITYGGGTSGLGTIFKLTPNGTLMTLHTFAPGAGNTYPDGAHPNCIILGTDGNLYGTSTQDGFYLSGPPVLLGNGTIWKITTAGVFTVLHTFPGEQDFAIKAYGAIPTGIYQAENGNFYGATVWGGQNEEGVLFEMTPSGTYTVLHSFGAVDPNTGANVDGTSPLPPVQLSDGNLYGVTSYGGVNNTGTVYKLSLTGTFTSIHSFAAMATNASNSTNIGGAHPRKLFVGPSGRPYGVASDGGDTGHGYGAGTLFWVNYVTGAVTTAFNFYSTTAVDGQNPKDAFWGTDGYIYACTFSSVNKISTAGVNTVLADYSELTSGTIYGDDCQGLTQGSNGYLYLANYGGGNMNANFTASGALDLLATSLPSLPSISSFYPTSRAHGTPGFTLTIAGQNFLPNSKVYYNGALLVTHYRTPTSLGADISTSLLSTAGTNTITVVTPTPGGGTSNASTFVVS